MLPGTSDVIQGQQSKSRLQNLALVGGGALAKRGVGSGHRRHGAHRGMHPPGS